MIDKIWDIINKYQSYGSVYMLDENDNECSLEEEIINLFIKEKISQFSVEVFSTFDNPSLTVYAIAISYITPQGQLEMITDYIDCI